MPWAEERVSMKEISLRFTGWQTFYELFSPTSFLFFRHAQFEREMAWESSRKAPESFGENATENALAFAAET